MRKIGVEKSLSNVADYLTEQGYSVQILGESIDNNISKLDQFDAIVTSDYNTNMLGYSDPETKVPIINASGLTPEEVKCRVDRASKK